MKGRIGYLILAALLTALDELVTVYCGTTVWTASSGDLPARGLLVVLAILGAASLANVWGQAGSGFNIVSESRETRGRQTPEADPAEAGGDGDV